MSDADLPDRSGELIEGRFRLTKRLGAGGMGEVYKAVNEVLGREVAIKLLKPEYARVADVVQRVEREARAANVVRHPNIVDVVDVLKDANGAPVIVQELLIGEDLATYVQQRGGALSEAESLDLMIPVTEALGAAHAAGIMHRDLKLENVFLDRRNGALVPKVLDFGLSRNVGEGATSRLTATGVAMGTPMYMSPEQVQGQRDIDQRTDVWALGVMLYELVAGRLPFDGESLGAIFVKVCTVDPPPLATVAPHVSAPFVAVVSRCLQRAREQRFASGAEVATALRAARSGASSAINSAGRIDAARDVTLAAADASEGARGTPVLGSSQPSPAPERASTLGPRVSHASPAPKRNTAPMIAAAVATFALVAGGAWFALREREAPAAVTPSAPPPASPTQGTTHYDPSPAPPVTPIATQHEPPPDAAPLAPLVTTPDPPAVADAPSPTPSHPTVGANAPSGAQRFRRVPRERQPMRDVTRTARHRRGITQGTTEYDGN